MVLTTVAIVSKGNIRDRPFTATSIECYFQPHRLQHPTSKVFNRYLNVLRIEAAQPQSADLLRLRPPLHCSLATRINSPATSKLAIIELPP